MNRIVLNISAGLLLLGVVLPSGGRADVIRVIQDDGTVVEIDMGAPPPAPVEQTMPPAARQPAPEPVAEPEPVAQEQIIPEPEVSTVPVEALRPELEPMSPVADEISPVLADEPAAEPVSSPEQFEEQFEASVPVGDAYTWPPIPMRKPAAAQYASPEAYAPSRADMATQGTITKDVALAIALENGAPAARSVQVLPRTYEGRSIFVVQFRTDQGLYDMLIDRSNGKIIERKF